MRRLLILGLIISNFATADYLVTEMGGIDFAETSRVSLFGAELTYYGFWDYLEAGAFVEKATSVSPVFGGVITRVYVPIVGLFGDVKIGNGLGADLGIRLSLPLIDLKPFIGVISTFSGGSTANAGLMASIKL